MTTLHITNGDSAARGLVASGIVDTVIPWRDVLHDGPVPPDINRRAFRTVRAEFLSRVGWASASEVLADMEARDVQVDATVADDEVVLWFEPDLYDQLQLAQLLSRFAEREAALRPSLFIVPADVLLGPLEPSEFPPLHRGKRAVRDADLVQGARAWRALTDFDPEALAAMAREPQPAPRLRSYAANPEARVPYLTAALRRLLEEYPSTTNGLARTEMQLCELLSAGAEPLGACFEGAHHRQEEWVWLGDWSFAWYVERLSACRRPLVVRVDGTTVDHREARTNARRFWAERIELTPFGRDVLDGRADHVEANGIDRWIGSVHLTDGRYWRWDARGQRLEVG